MIPEVIARQTPRLRMTGLALAGAALTLLPAATAAQTPTAGVLDTAPSTIDCSALQTDPAQLGAASMFVVDASQSEARYIAEEELAGVGANTAIGKTNTIDGAFLFDAEGNPIPCSTVYVDVRTFESDSSRRDNFLRGNTLQSDQYPLAEFVVTSVEGFTMPADGEETTFTLVGNFTLHGVTKTMAWSVTASKSGDTLKGTAKSQFDMADFNIEKPIVGSVLSIQDTIQLEIDLVATNSAAG